MPQTENNAVIEIVLRGGLVETVKAPKGATITIYDYDVEGTELDVQSDPDGEEFIEFTHTGTGEFD